MEGHAAAKYPNSPKLADRHKKRLFPGVQTSRDHRSSPEGQVPPGTPLECLLVSCVQRMRQGLSQTRGDIGLPTSEETFAFRKHLCREGQVWLPRWSRKYHSCH